MAIVRATVCLVFAVLSTGCGSSTIIAPTTPQGFEAVHFDQLLGSACKAGNEQCGFLGSFALPPAFGAMSVPVSIDSGSGPFVWRAFAFDIADSSASTHTVSDSVTFMAYSDTNVSAGVLVALFGPSSRLTDTTNVDAVLGAEISDSIGVAQGPCAKPPTLRHTSVPRVSGASCTIQSIVSGFTLGFRSGVTFTMAPQSVNGFRILRVNP